MTVSVTARHRCTFGLLLLWVTLGCNDVNVEVVPPQCAPLRERTPAHAEVLSRSATVKLLLQGVPYAGDAENPRPVPRRTIYDIAAEMTADLRMGRSPALENSKYFAFVTDRA